MADFREAHGRVMGHEGGYAHNPSDAGGETYKGIARNYHPNWRGWTAIDRIVSKLVRMPDYGSSGYYGWVKVLNRTAEQDSALQSAVLDFYQKGFWDANRLSEVTDQRVATWIYDHAVNGGARGVMWAQAAARVTVDGGLGLKTLSAINAMDPDDFLNRAEDIAGAFRLDRMSAKPSQIQFGVSWLTRDGQPPEVIAAFKKAAADGVLSGEEVAVLKGLMESTA